MTSDHSTPRFEGQPLNQRTVGSQARAGARSGFVAQALMQMGSLGATMVMARLLSTAEFGLIAIVQSVMGVSALLGVSGVGAALVTRASDVERAASAYFWYLSIIGSAAALAIIGFSGPLTQLLGLSEAEPYLRALSLILPISLMSIVPVALLLRLRKFNAHRAVALLGSFIYFVTEIALVLNGWGVWSVIVGQLSGGVASLVSALFLARWLPRHGLSLSVVKSDMGNVGGLGLNAVFRYLYTNLDYWAVSRLLGAGPLGAYYIAYVLPSILRLRLTDMFRTVMLPVLSGPSGLKHPQAAYLRAVTMLMFVSFPSLAGVAVLAGPIVAVFFGPQWDEAVTPMRLIIVGTMLDLVIQSVATFAVARRRVAGLSWASGIRVLLTLAAFSVVLPISRSTTAVALAVVLATFGALILQEVLVANPLGVGLCHQWRTIARIMGPTFLMVVVTTGAQSLLINHPPIISLLVCVPVGVATFAVGSMVMARRLCVDSVSQIILLLAPSKAHS